MKHLSSQSRDNIVSLLDMGYSSRQIEERLGVGHSTVDRVRASERPDAVKSRGGRPAKLNATDRRRLGRMIVTGAATNASAIAKNFVGDSPSNCSTKTIRRALKALRFRAIVMRKRPRVLVRHICKRLKFARAHQHWTVEDWKRVVWSDETKINRLGSDGREYTWIRDGVARNQSHYKGTVKFGGGSLMFWGCMMADGIGYGCQIEGNMDAETYTGILKDYMLSSLEYYEKDSGDIVFQQDNDPKHTSKLAKKWFVDNGIEVMEWPAQSPDLNPIEHLWVHLKRKLKQYATEPTSIHELWARVDKEWNDISPEVCLGLIESMPRRIAAVIRAKGGNTNY
jgi:transposase